VFSFESIVTATLGAAVICKPRFEAGVAIHACTCAVTSTVTNALAVLAAAVANAAAADGCVAAVTRLSAQDEFTTLNDSVPPAATALTNRRSTAFVTLVAGA